MDFLDPNKKKSTRLKLYLGYFLVATAISMGALVLLFANYGYRLDKSGRVTQNGLVFFSSQPSGAQLYIEGLFNKYKTQAQTNTRLELKEGRYRATIIKDNYRSWQREFSLEGGSVERMVYPFLFPKKLETTDLKKYTKTPSLVTSSPDRQWIIIQQPDNFGNFDVLNANDPKKAATTFAVPQGVLSPATSSHSLELVEWSTDNANMLLKHIFDSKTEFVVINRDKPAESFNVNILANQTPFDVALKDKKADQLYLHMASGGLLQTFDVKTKVFTPLVQKVYAYKPHGDDMLVYVAPKKADPNQSEARIQTKDKDYVLRDLPASPSYVVDVARFSDDWYIVAGANSDKQVYVYKNPLDVLANDRAKISIFARTLRIKNPQNVSFSANARFVAVQSGQSFAVYDAETDRQYRYDIKDKFDTEKPAIWMDGHRLTSSTDNQVLVFDFDGINSQKLMKIDPATDVMFDRDYKVSYALSLGEDSSAALTNTKLTVE